MLAVFCHVQSPEFRHIDLQSEFPKVLDGILVSTNLIYI